MLATENTVPFQDFVEKLARQLLRRLTLSIAKWVGASLWAAAILAASYYLVVIDAADKKEQLSLVVAVIFTAITGALENFCNWYTDSREYKGSVKGMMRQLGFLSACSSRDPILRVLQY
ncbi:hypothetical protein PF005_g14808 [Phytophthora fragariae]|uniref:Uncharacterized protein n=1 Tax=Phytophthora fragariae TaxID=53985 RepID=A0A6A3RXQ8_9STRA|nr:hypothetical protein PF003_g32858 [Phytophthora fragariae]KAE8933869.1 hypothetical protein PF009_g16144 [Phytophthora fragariae]KAE9001570.1 hypothetical protein PF011_g13689 [Phytophthora fragariae]KAE9098124.1 hypothetical protein PF010_g15680 [Phytophthora fragariae]KAE9102442.1 hypothetical protein PF007_g14766 [Phytophthora fragariae]